MDPEQQAAAGNGNITLVECPRDAMQGWPHFIDTDQKVRYLNALLQVGFDTLDFGSFVSARAIPQMADTKSLVGRLDLSGSRTRLLAIVANVRGAEEAAAYGAIHFLGFPFSISETFQQRNTNSSIEKSLKTVEAIQGLCAKWGKELVVYLSMGFGNPYGDPYSKTILLQWAKEISATGVGIISMADTVGLATPEQVFENTSSLIDSLPDKQIGLHLHAKAADWPQKVKAGLRAGCRRFDGALLGIGGCPMAGDELVGNLNSSLLIPFFQGLGILGPINKEALAESEAMAKKIFTV